jgi:hypothetical protein
MTILDFLSNYIDTLWTALIGIIAAVYTVSSKYTSATAQYGIMKNQIHDIEDHLTELDTLVHDTRDDYATSADLEEAIDSVEKDLDKSEKKLETLITGLQLNKAERATCTLMHELNSVKAGRRVADVPVSINKPY